MNEASLCNEIVRKDFSWFHFQHEKSFNFCKSQIFSIVDPLLPLLHPEHGHNTPNGKMILRFFRCFVFLSFFSSSNKIEMKQRWVETIASSHRIQYYQTFDSRIVSKKKNERKTKRVSEGGDGAEDDGKREKQEEVKGRRWWCWWGRRREIKWRRKMTTEPLLQSMHCTRTFEDVNLYLNNI